MVCLSFVSIVEEIAIYFWPTVLLQGVITDKILTFDPVIWKGYMTPDVYTSTDNSKKGINELPKK